MPICIGYFLPLNEYFHNMVSIIITTYYRNDDLEDAIESALSQSYANIEIIVVDGSGERHAEDTVAEYDIEYIAQKENRGIAADRDLGIRTATHDRIHFLDDDDQLEATAVEKKAEVMGKSANVGVVYSGIKWENGHEVNPNPDIYGNVIKYALTFEMSPCLPSTMLIDRKLLETITPTAKLPGDDGPMKIELARRTEFAFVDEALTKKGDSEDALSSGGGEIDEDDESVRLSIIDYYDSVYDELDPGLKRKALRRSHLLEAAVRMENRMWSGKAIHHMILANYYSSGFDLECSAGLLASLFGRPAWNLGRTIHNRFILGDSHEGSIA